MDDFLKQMDDKGLRKDKLEQALDDVYAKFGDKTIFSGRQLKPTQRKNNTANPKDSKDIRQGLTCHIYLSMALCVTVMCVKRC